MEERIVVLIDMDCFYCQVEEQLRPEIRGKPVAVVQYNQWQGGGIIAVNYEARARGVTRHMRGDEARKHCPEIELAIVPSQRGKADTSKYREAGKKVAHVLQEFTPLLERASVDEAYLDITQLVKSKLSDYTQSQSIPRDKLPNTYILGYDTIDKFIEDVYEGSDVESDLIEFDGEHSKRLLIGALIVSEIRAAVFEKTGYECSAGIAHNKIMAKLVCGINKPNKQTVLAKHRISDIFTTLPLTKIKSLGGKFGEYVCKTLNITTMKELAVFTEKELQKHFEDKNGSFLYNIARGVDNEPVTPRFTSKSIGCCKKFPGKTAIVNTSTLKHWLTELGSEIEERLKMDSDENNRHPTQMVVSYIKESNRKDVSCSKSVNMTKDDIFSGEILTRNAFNIVLKDVCGEKSDDVEHVLKNPVKFLGISVGKFEDDTDPKKDIKHFFNKITADSAIPSTSTQREVKPEPKIDKPQPESFIAKYLQKLKDKEEKPIDELSVNENSNMSTGSVDSEISKSFNSTAVSPVKNVDRSLSISKFFDSKNDVDEPIRTFCDQCNKYIPQSETVTHADYHLALSLRDEDRKAVHQTKKTSKPKSNSIVDLFSKINSMNAEPSEPCAVCGKNIPLTKLSEHADFHEAKKLHDELNKRDPSVSPKRRKVEVSKKTEKRPNTKPINSFFAACN